jgi:cytochrome d ubiquinol oxidase subunit I
VTTSGNVWYFFAAALVIYAVIGTATILVLRGMRQRWAAGAEDDRDVPYGPSTTEDAQRAGERR